MEGDIGIQFAEFIWNADELKLLNLLKDGACPNVITPGGFTPLFLACKRGSPPLIELLLSFGADPYFEVEGEHAARYLVTEGSWSPFMKERFEALKVFINHKIDLTKNSSLGYSILDCAWEAGHGDELSKLMIASKLNPSIPSPQVRLLSAVKKKQLKTVHELLLLGISPNFRSKTDDSGLTPLMIACAQGDFDTAQILLAFGANSKIKTIRMARLQKKIQNPQTMSQFQPETSVLEIAIKRGIYRVIELILNANGQSTFNPIEEKKLLVLINNLERPDLIDLLKSYNYFTTEFHSELPTLGKIVPLALDKSFNYNSVVK